MVIHLLVLFVPLGNFDGASKGNQGLIGFKGVFRNNEGIVIQLFHGNLGQETKNTAKLEDMLRGIKLALSKGWEPLKIEGNSHIIIQMEKRL